MQRIVLIFIFLGYMMNVFAYEKNPQLSDFAYGYNLQLQGAGSLYQVNIPLSVYQQIARSDLGDIRVFNAAGEIMPYSILPAEQEKVAETKGIPYFPIYGAANSSFENLNLRVRRGNDDAIISLHSNKNETKQILRGYILDLSHLHKTGALKLEFFWDNKNNSGNWIDPIAISQSNDLHSWHTVINDTSLAHLNYGNEHITQREVSLTNITSKYLLVSWPMEKNNFVLTKVTGTLTNQRDRQIEWIMLTPTEIRYEQGEYEFNLPGFVPIEKINLAFPDKNNIIQANIFSRANQQQPWRLHYRGSLYNITANDKPIQNPAINVGAINDSQWLVQTTPSDALGKIIPKLVLGVRPARLVFVARGSGPFILAFGSSSVQAPQNSLTDFLAQAEEKTDNNLTVYIATIGDKRVLSGESALAVIKKINYKQWILWSILVLGAIILALMVINLYKQLNRQDEIKNA